jgi:integrase
MHRTRYPGIYRRENRYIVVWRHRGRQHKSYHRTIAEAREAQGRRRQPSDRRPSSREAFEQYATRWIEFYGGRTARGFTETTRRDYRRAIEQRAVPFFRGYRLADIEPQDVRGFVTSMEGEGLAPGSVVKNLTPIKAMLATAFEDGAIRSNPAQGVRVNGRRYEPDTEPEAKAMTRVELARVLASLPDRWRLFFDLLAQTGLRISEALGLDWSDLEFGARPRLRVRRQFYRGEVRRLKTRSGRRELPLSSPLARRLWSARPADGAGPMFASRNGTRLIDRNVRRVLDEAKVEAGVPWISFHSFRHTAASMLFDSGKNIRQVCDWLGHADPAFTLRAYIHLIDDGLGDAEFLDPATWSNAGATEHPQTAANEKPPGAAAAAV